MSFGSAENSTGQAINWKEEEFIPKFKQGILEFSLDSLFEMPNVPFPNYIKIDVDGIEDKIIAGGENTFKNQSLKEILVELDEKHSKYEWCLRTIESYGFKLRKKCQSQVFSNGPYKNMYNHIFIRS